MGQGQACRCGTLSLQPEWVLPPTIQLCTDCTLTCYIFKKGLGIRQTNLGFLGNTGGRKIWWKFRSSIEENSAAAAKLHQSCPTLCDPIDGSPPGSPVPGILQTKTLEWVAISFSNAWKWKVKVKSLSHVWLFTTPWTAAHQAPPTMGFSRQEHWSGVPLPSPVSWFLSNPQDSCFIEILGPNTMTHDLCLFL